MKYAFIESGVVVEVARVNPFGIFNHSYASKFVEVPDEVEPGWNYDGENFYKPQEEPAPVPKSCTRRQGRLALLQSGLLDDAESIISGIADQTERRAAQIEYGADTWERSNAFLQQMWGLLGGNDETLDDLFRLAVTL